MPPYTDTDLAADVEQHHWVVLKMTPERAPEYGYSVGLTKSFGHPEVVVVGLDDETMQDLINEIGEAVQAGGAFNDGDMSPAFLEGYDVAFKAVPAQLHAAQFAWAARFYGDAGFRMLQVVYPDRDRHWPWDADVDPELRKGQPLLGDAAG